MKYHVHSVQGAFIGLLILLFLGVGIYAMDNRTEITNLRNIVHTQNENAHDTQFQYDQLQRYVYEHATGQTTDAEFGAKVEAIEPRSPLFKIEKHGLMWEDEKSQDSSADSR